MSDPNSNKEFSRTVIFLFGVLVGTVQSSAWFIANILAELVRRQ